MERRIIAVAVAAAMVLCLVPALADDSDADSVRTVYFYGDNPIFLYGGTYVDGMDLRWTVISSDGDEMEWERYSSGDQFGITVDVSGEPFGEAITVIQEALHQGESVDIDLINAIPLHGADGYTITFVDGLGNRIVRSIDNTTMVDMGDDHVEMPDDPVRDNYRFDGWYTDNYSREFDSTQPVTSDMTVYAKWVGTGSSGGGEEDVGFYTVTFTTTIGLEYTITAQTDSSVSFTVDVVGGYQLAEGTLSVTSDRGTITESDGVYTLSGIDGNTLVTISGDVSMIDPDEPNPDPVPEDPDPVPDKPSDGQQGNDFPWWIVIVLVLVILVLLIVLFAVWRHRSDRS